MTDDTRKIAKWKITIGVAIIALAGAAGGFGLAGWIMPGGDAGMAMTDGECEDVLYWYDPMVPGQRFDAPGPSPFMDMQLVPKCAGGEAQGSGVSIDPAMVQNLGIRTVAAEYGMLEPGTIVTGTLAYNGGAVANVQPRTGGYVQRTYGLAPQDVVVSGAPIADVLVPEWGGAQAEYLAVRATGDEPLARAARERLRLLGMPDTIISSVERSGRPQSTITVTAPQSGAITMLGVRPGMTVSAGQSLAEISSYSPIWLEAAVPEAQAGSARVGQPVSATLTAFPDERFAGRIIAILPGVAEASRTLTVRAALPNPGLRLKPGMFAQVTLSSEQREALLVPSEAVIRTGERTLVMIAREGGGYRPAEVRIGREAGGRTEILAGLGEGEEVVSSGQFLLDSEASLSGIDVRAIDDAPTASARGEGRANTESPRVYRANGTVQRISGRSVTLRHGPVPALGWPAMTMAFAAEGPDQLRGLRQGDRVSFTFEQADTGPHIVSIRKAGE
ncbi:MAG: efflux RND transporter periplasmic adaptor subunit [Sphingomonadaceae bacterium]|nr:efflux RND transporter periplasmic adaptor subunit [Sphingomonadaceae bacterium]